MPKNLRYRCDVQAAAKETNWKAHHGKVQAAFPPEKSGEKRGGGRARSGYAVLYIGDAEGCFDNSTGVLTLVSC